MGDKGHAWAEGMPDDLASAIEELRPSNRRSAIVGWQAMRADTRRDYSQRIESARVDWVRWSQIQQAIGRCIELGEDRTD